MYAPFFGLEHPPFSIAPDPRYLFMSERHREALAHLLYGLDAGGGFVLLTGEVGAGKTTVCRCFLEQIPKHCNVAYIFNPKLTVEELLRTICDEFGVAHRPHVAGVETVKDYIDPLNASLLEAHAAGRNTVLIIDEAQNLSADVLEQLRLLTNLETNERKLLQIILIGQPELRAMVASAPLEQLAQRVIARFHLGALSLQETQHYIAHRLAVAGLQGPVPFTARALRRIYGLSRGVPRRINLLCDRALLGAYAAGVREVSVTIVNRAGREVFDAPTAASIFALHTAAGRGAAAQLPRWVVAGVGAVAGAVLVGALGWAAGVWPVLQPGGRGDGAPAAALTGAAARQPLSTTAATPSKAAANEASLPTLDLQRFLTAQPTGDAAAWQTLAAAWGVGLADGTQACAALLRDGLRCYRSSRAGLPLVRQIDRPVMLRLFVSNEDEAAVFAVLRHLDGDTATLEGAGQTLRVPIAQLARVWRGDIATLWRAPPGMPDVPGRGEMTATAEGMAWLAQQLATAAPGGAGPGSRPAPRTVSAARIQQFQLAQGLTPDGRAGVLTLMLLSRLNGMNEPRLRTGV